MRPLAKILPFLIVAGALSHLRQVSAKDGRTPEWILPVDTARAVAKRERKPLLIISLNGNLDGNC